MAFLWYGKAFANRLHQKTKNVELEKIYLLLETVDFDDPVGHLFVVDIHFDHKRASTRQVL